LRSPFLGFGSEGALRHIAEALADGLFTTDAEGRVTYWNAAAERITGWTSAEAIGTSCSILAGDSVSGCSCGLGPIRCGLALAGRSSKQCTVRTKDGRLLTIVKSAVPIRDASGHAIGALESFTPIRDAATPPDPVPGAGLAGLVGRHPAMQELYRMIELVAASNATVMICGESGTGKDRVAEAIHRLGPRAARPLVRVPCASVEAALDPDAPGAPASEARGGTLVLDEVGNLTAAAQLRVLHFLERREAARAAGAPATDDARLLCTTHCDLLRMVDEKQLRADLYFRLNVFPIRVPPLREHLDDVPLIAEQFLARRTPPGSLSRDGAIALMARPWPGNVRELQNALEFAALHAGGLPISAAHLPPDPAAGPRPNALDDRARLTEALARSGGNRTLAARSLGISRVTLWKRLKRHGLQ
jgi:PAS domain S-box-containing protein